MTKERLEDGNRRFASSVDREALGAQASGQHPYACVVSCSDSRVPPELIFGAGLGELFVVRTAGNTVSDPTVMASIEYAVERLGVTLVLVLGHTDCGVMKAAIQRGLPGGQMGRLVMRLRECGIVDDPREMALKNARRQSELVMKDSSIVREAVEKGRTRVLVALYDVATGTVEFH